MPISGIDKRLTVGVVGKNNHAARIISIIDKSENANCTKIFYPKETDSADPRITKSFCDITLCDAIVIATPTSTHFEYLKKLTKYDGYILVEKPIVANKQETDILSNWPSSRKKKVKVNYNFLNSPVVKSIKSIMQENRIGNEVLLEIHSCHGLAYKQAYKENWRSNSTSYGVDGLVCVHFINAAIEFFGPIESSDIDNINVSNNGESADTVFINLKMFNAVRVHIWLSYASPYKFNISLYGDNGIYVYDGNSEILRSPRDTFDEFGRFTDPPVIYNNALTFRDNWDDSLNKSIDEFIEIAAASGEFDLDHFETSLHSMIPIFSN